MQYKRRIFLALLAIALGVSLIVGLTVSAVPGSGDLDDDGKLTIHDAQLLLEAKNGTITLTSQQEEAAGNLLLTDIVSRLRDDSTDGLVDTDNDGYNEISTVQGLYNMAKNPAGKYKLTQNIDMRGLHWTPMILEEGGELDGNGKEIRNVTITQGVKTAAARESTDQGFFAEIRVGAKVQRLTLNHVNITAAQDAQFIGLLAGTNRGTAEKVYCVGSVTDMRESVVQSGAGGAGNKTHIGAVIGRNMTNASYTSYDFEADLPVIKDAPYSEVAYDGISTTTRIPTCAEFALYLAPGRTDVTRGLVSYDATKTVTGQYQDITGSYELSDEIRARQDAVVDYMWEMGTYKWQVPENISYQKNAEAGCTEYVGGNYRYGLFYNQNSGSLERAEYTIDNWTDLKNKYGGTYDTSVGVDNWLNSDGNDNGLDGWARFMGNDCSTAVGWAWWRVSPANTSDTHRGVRVDGTYVLVPTQENQDYYGIVKLGEYTIPEDFVQNVSTTEDIWLANSANGSRAMYEALALARKGDALMSFIGEGHTRLIAYDPVVIRNTDGSIDAEKSYFIVHEHGGREEERATNTWYPRYTGVANNGFVSSQWGINQLYRFSDLNVNGLGNGDDGDTPSRCYLPITCRALRDESVKAVMLNDEIPDQAITAPDAGYLWSNYRIISATVTVMQNGEQKAQQTAFSSMGAGARTNQTDARRGEIGADGKNRDWGTQMSMAEYFGDIYGDLPAGEYTFTVDVLLSTGETMPLDFGDGVTERSFTYAP